MTEKHWHGDTLNNTGSKVIQIRNDKQVFVIKTENSEVILDRSEALFLFISLKGELD